MKHILTILLLVIAAFCMAAEDYIDDTITGFQNFSDSIIFDSFVPITFFESSKSSISGIKSYYWVDTLLSETSGIGPDIQGDELGANAFSIFGSYTISNQMAVFGLYSGTRFAGSAEYEADDLFGYSGESDLSDSGMRVGIFGIAYDVLPAIEGRKLSVPIYAALKIRTNNVDMGYTHTLPGSFSIEDSDTYTDLLVGAAASFKLNSRLQVTPYALIGLMNKYTYKVDSSLPLQDYEFEISDATFRHGVELSYKSKKNFLSSLSLDGSIDKINPLSKGFLQGLEMQSVSVSIGYTF